VETAEGASAADTRPGFIDCAFMKTGAQTRQASIMAVGMMPAATAEPDVGGALVFSLNRGGPRPAGFGGVSAASAIGPSPFGYRAYRTDAAAGQHPVRSSKDYSSIVISSRTRRRFRGRGFSINAAATTAGQGGLSAWLRFQFRSGVFERCQRVARSFSMFCDRIKSCIKQ